MVPTTATALLVFAVAVLPGAMYRWGYERQAGSYGVTFADRAMRFVATSVIFDALYALPAYAVARLWYLDHAIGPGRFVVLWVGALAGIALPILAGTVVGGLYATRRRRSGWRWVRRRWLTAERETRLLRLTLGPSPAPRAWDDLFTAKPRAYLRIRTRMAPG